MATFGRSTGFQQVGNYTEGLKDDPRNYISELERIVGRIPDHIKYDFMHNQSRTFGDLTELLLDRVTPVLTSQVTGLLEKTYVSPYTSFLLPIRQLGPYESINVKWTEVNFNPGIAPQVETLGLGRYYTHNKTRRGARAVRRGAAVKIEAGFFMTPEGQEEWRLQIEQLVTVIQNTNELDVVLTLLQTPMRTERHANEMNGPYNRIYGVNHELSFDKRMELERDMWGIVNKTPDSRGFSSLVTNLRTVMKRNGVEPDAIIVPPYLLGYYYTTKDDLWQYSSAGPAVANNRKMAEDIGGDSAYRSMTIQGMKIIDTYIYRAVPGARESVTDLLTAPHQIGEYYPMEIGMIYRDTKSFANYRSDHRNLRIFNEDHSRMSTVYWSDAVRNCLRWNDDTQGSLNDVHDSCNNDMFKNGGVVVKCWGEMDEKYLSNFDVENVVTSMVANLLPDRIITLVNENDAGAIEKLVKKISDIVRGNTAFADATVAADVVFDEDSFDINGSRVAGWNELIENKTTAERICAYLFLRSHICRENILRFHDADVYVPVDFILARPYMTYNVSSVIVMKAGRDTGETIIGQQDFQMSSNTQDRTLEASYVYYGKAIVRNTRNVVVAPRVFIQEYVSGNNTKFITQQTVERQINQRSGIFEGDESILAMMIPVRSNTFEHNWIDIRGFNENVENKKHFHQSSDFYKTILEIDPQDIASPTEDFIDYEDMTFAANTLCWLGHFEYGPGFSYVSKNTGHHGPETYDQVNFSRKPGVFAPVKNLTYNTKSLS
jgi:hypothetical protein